MPPIDSFSSTFSIFLNTGRFEISDSSLSLKQLQTIHSHLKKYPVPLGRTISFYEVHLNNVEFIPFDIEELIEPKGYESTVLLKAKFEQRIEKAKNSDDNHVNDQVLSTGSKPVGIFSI